MPSIEVLTERFFSESSLLKRSLKLVRKYGVSERLGLRSQGDLWIFASIIAERQLSRDYSELIRKLSDPLNHAFNFFPGAKFILGIAKDPDLLKNEMDLIKSKRVKFTGQNYCTEQSRKRARTIELAAVQFNAILESNNGKVDESRLEFWSGRIRTTLEEVGQALE